MRVAALVSALPQDRPCCCQRDCSSASTSSDCPPWPSLRPVCPAGFHCASAMATQREILREILARPLLKAVGAQAARGVPPNLSTRLAERRWGRTHGAGCSVMTEQDTREQGGGPRRDDFVLWSDDRWTPKVSRIWFWSRRFPASPRTLSKRGPTAGSSTSSCHPTW
jgi:hypothetical protein